MDNIPEPYKSLYELRNELDRATQDLKNWLVKLEAKIDWQAAEIRLCKKMMAKLLSGTE